MKHILAVLFLFSSYSAIANIPSDEQQNFSFASGIGAQYGGILGVKVNYRANQELEPFISVGLLGASAGVEYFNTKKQSFNAYVGHSLVAELTYIGAEFNYYFGDHRDGFVLGGGLIGTYGDDCSFWCGNNVKKETRLGIIFNLGYRF